ncbi:response regulator transcription factor [Thermophagus sp. OGC60D27]|uniref:response regulator transcription factor n=1 Tax=Thermophagus sp. OGC60D27 TaxID=3458415 RepID=UPI004037E10D
MTFVKHLIKSVGSANMAGIRTIEKTDIRTIFEIFSQMMNQSIYVADFTKGKFLYVSNHPLFLCGHPPDEVMEMGFSYYEKIIAPEDMPLFRKINEIGFRFFYEKPSLEWKKNCYLSFDFRIKQPDGKNIRINHKCVPMEMTENNRMTTGVCFVSPSHASLSGNALIQNLNKPIQYRLNPTTRRFELRDYNLLTEREKEILFLSTQGATNSEIAEKLKLSLSTIKQHKHNIFRKLKVTNTSEAVYYAKSNRLF